jgi:hypothetical protein
MLLDGIYNIIKLIYEEGEKEWLDETKYFDALSELCMSLEKNEITEAEYEETEVKILEQLKTVRNYKKEHGYTC